MWGENRKKNSSENFYKSAVTIIIKTSRLEVLKLIFAILFWIERNLQRGKLFITMFFLLFGEKFSISNFTEIRCEILL